MKMEIREEKRLERVKENLKNNKVFISTLYSLLVISLAILILNIGYSFTKIGDIFGGVQFGFFIAMVVLVGVGMVLVYLAIVSDDLLKKKTSSTPWSGDFIEVKRQPLMTPKALYTLFVVISIFCFLGSIGIFFLFWQNTETPIFLLILNITASLIVASLLIIALLRRERKEKEE
jgi:hypothetical protein